MLIVLASMPISEAVRWPPPLVWPDTVSPPAAMATEVTTTNAISHRYRLTAASPLFAAPENPDWPPGAPLRPEGNKERCLCQRVPEPSASAAGLRWDALGLRDYVPHVGASRRALAGAGLPYVARGARHPRPLDVIAR